MGTDISVHIEKRNKETGKWEDLYLYRKNKDGEFERCFIYPGRNYELFSLLSEVNSFHWPLSNPGYLVEPRGLPEDISDYTRECWGDGTNYFGATWYDYQELSTYTHLLNEANKMMNEKNARIKELEKEVKKLNKELKKSYGKKDDDWEEVEYLDDDEDNVIDSLNGFMSCIDNVLDGCNMFNPKQGEVRIVIWFDN